MRTINILFFETINSTSTYARQNAEKLPLPSLIIANEQTSGRGRRGNSFFSPKNTGLYMTLLIKEPENCELLTPAAAVSVCKTLEKYNIQPEIKWVNDLYMKDKKVCGILSERFIVNNNPIIAIGIGINLTTEHFPDELPNAGCIGFEYDKINLAKEISADLILRLNGTDIINEYKKRLFILNKDIVFTRDGITENAKAVDINENCNLIIKYPDGTTDVLSSGEISIKI